MSLETKKRFLSRYGTPFLFLFLFALRAIYLTADPPVTLDWSGGIFFDEGMLAHGARNKILFNTWDLDGWNDFYISPILAYLKWLVFYVFGVGIAQVRLIPLFFSYLTLVFFYLTFKESVNRKTALLATFLLGFNYIFIMFNRLGLTETSVVFFMVLTAYLWQKGMRMGVWEYWEISYTPTPPHSHTPTYLIFFLTGVSTFTAYVFKNYPYFLPVPVVAALLSFYILPKRQPAPKETAQTKFFRRIAASPLLHVPASMLLGMFLPFLIWYYSFYLPYFQSINQAMNYFKRQSLPRSFEQVLFNVSHLPFFYYFLKTPVILFLSFFAVGYFIYLFFHNPKPRTLPLGTERTPDSGLRIQDPARILPIDLFMVCWYLAHFFLYAGLNYRPLRYYLPIIPPMCALAARVMISLSSARSIKLPERLSVVSMLFLILWLTLLLGYGLIPLFHGLDQYFPGRFPDLTWERGMFSGLIISVIFVGFIVWISQKRQKGNGERDLVPFISRFFPFTFLILPLSAFIVINGYQYYQWAANPQYVIRTISLELGSTLKNAFIAGLSAPELCLENTHRAIHVFDNFFNFKTIFTKYRVTHLFMGEYNQEIEFYYRRFSYPMRRATLLKTYTIKGSHFYLYSMIEPSIDKIRVALEAQEPGPITDNQPVILTDSCSKSSDSCLVEVILSIKNNDPSNPRLVQPGWVLHPVRADAADITVTRPSSISLNSGESRSVTLFGGATPGTYKLMAFTLPSYQNIFEAELLNHLVGEKEKDPQAFNGEVWRIRKNDSSIGDQPVAPGYAVYGPYLRYPHGHMKVTYRLKAYDNTEDLPVAQIDVVSDMSEQVLASRDLRGTDFKAPGSYEEFELFCFLEDAEKLEFRVRSYGRVDLWIDHVRVEFTRGWWYEQPITVGKPLADL